MKTRQMTAACLTTLALAVSAGCGQEVGESGGGGAAEAGAGANAGNDGAGDDGAGGDGAGADGASDDDAENDDDAGGEPGECLAAPDPMPVDYTEGCEQGCGQLAGCAIDQGLCSGAQECDREGFVGMCLSVCNEQLLAVFSTLNGCEEIVGLASQSLPGFPAACDESDDGGAVGPDDGGGDGDGGDDDVDQEGECLAAPDPMPVDYAEGCEQGCGQLAGCAIDEGTCPTASECDRNGFVGLCLGVCNEQLLGVFATLNGCEEIIGLANQSLGADFVANCGMEE